jgi:hypothetical protein
MGRGIWDVGYGTWDMRRSIINKVGNPLGARTLTLYRCSSAREGLGALFATSILAR